MTDSDDIIRKVALSIAKRTRAKEIPWKRIGDRMLVTEIGGNRISLQPNFPGLPLGSVLKTYNEDGVPVATLAPGSLQYEGLVLDLSSLYDIASDKS